jgi:FkbM family methyltransferase
MRLHKGWAFPDADQFMASELHDDGTYQAAHLRAALLHVTDFRCAIDGGAHVGTWSRLMDFPFARVIAVEPSADTFECLQQNKQVQGWAHVELRQVALGAKAGTARMVLDGRALTLKNTGARYLGAGTDVKVEAIDDWQLPALGFLKLDVEGSELAALRGAVRTLQRCRPIVLYENKGFWTRYGAARNAPAVFLQSLGYRQLAEASMDLIWGPPVRSR